MELGSYFLFLQEQIKDIIISGAVVGGAEPGNDNCLLDFAIRCHVEEIAGRTPSPSPAVPAPMAFAHAPMAPASTPVPHGPRVDAGRARVSRLQGVFYYCRFSQKRR
jgi:hypothetical protein